MTAASVAEQRAALDKALDDIYEARELIGYQVPAWAQRWAETNGLNVRESRFAPPGLLFIAGLIPVEDIEVPS